MASGGKLSKTARASLGKDKNRSRLESPVRSAPPLWLQRGSSNRRDMPGGMYWVCPKDDFRLKT